jgi:hypothetical protein
MAYLGINSAAPEEWDRLKKAYPAIENPSIVLENTANDDLVNSPKHYGFGKVECIEAISESMTKEAFKGYLKGNCLKYLWRYERKEKEPAQDLKKAQWYLAKLIDEITTGG